MDLSHLDALRSRLDRETRRLDAAQSDGERIFRQRQIAQCKKEIAGEYRFLGIDPIGVSTVSDAELMAELEGLT